MDFFEHQEVAKKRTTFLIIYFALAIIGISISVYAVIALMLAKVQGTTAPFLEDSSLIQWDLFGYTTLGTLAVVLLGSGFKSLQLSAGGKKVATELGGRRIDPQTTNADERRLHNVVEEMAIASGVPVPEVFVMEEENTVNAFAAGKTTSDAVIGVTRGCIRKLSRDELQAVIAHEFSHILNGDMRLNMRLMALIFGITALTIIGRILLRASSGSREKGAAPFVLFGLSLVVIGFVGVLFGRLIQRAVSRQREFLADASAVQFTRNPDGMTGALKKIGALGSRIDEPHAEEASHMMIASALSNDRGSLFASHPPLAARIRAIDPRWDGTYDDVKFPSQAGPLTDHAPDSRSSTGGTPPPLGTDPFITTAILSAAALEGSQPGELQQAHLNRGQAIFNALPLHWREAANDSASAQAVIFALILAPTTPDTCSLHLAQLEDLDGTIGELSTQLHGEFSDLHSSHKLALVDLAIASLRRLSPDEYHAFARALNILIESDGQVDLFELTLRKMVRRHLDIQFQEIPPPKTRFRHLRQLQTELAQLLSALATVSAENQTQRQAAFNAGTSGFAGELQGRSLEYREDVPLDAIERALTQFDSAAPMVKKQLLYAAGRTVMHDGEVNSREAELLRAMADTIGVPIPPFVAA